MTDITLNIGSGNHGCTDQITVDFPSPRSTVGRVARVTHCSSCWQVGHDNGHDNGWSVGDAFYTLDIPAHDFIDLANKCQDFYGYFNRDWLQRFTADCNS